MHCGGMTRSFVRAVSPFALVLASCGSPSSAEKSQSGPEAPAVPAAPGTPAPPASTAAPAGSGFTTAEVAVFKQPWAMAFLPGTPYALVTERAGKLKLWQEGRPARDVAGVPAVDYGGQGGLGDVVPAPDYAQSGLVYLSWAEAGDGDTRGAAVGRARLVLDGTPRLERLQVIWRQSPKVTGRGHYSHRIAFSPDGRYLFVASGDRQKMTPAQDLSVNLGKIVRLLPDGSPAPGNPFASRGGVSPQIWSFGHRNILGLAFDPEGRLWDLEHGPAGGDELNLVDSSKNYGWPLVSDGDHYDGRPIPRHSSTDAYAKPAISWNPVIAPGDFIFYTGDAFPQWKGQALVAGMVVPAIVRVSIEGNTARELERIPFDNRLREIEQGPDGAIWLLEDGETGRLLKLSPR